MAPVRLDMDRIIDDRRTRIIVCCGSGGVGKTTAAAAIGLRAAERGRHTCVLTVGAPHYELPMIPDGIDLAGLYQLADALRQQGAA